MTTITYVWGLTLPNSLLLNTLGTGAQSAPAVAASADGSHYFGAWTHPGGSDSVQGQLVDQLGDPAGSQFIVNSTNIGDQNDASLAALHNGNYVAAFTDDSGANADIRLRIFGSNGSPIAPDFIVDPLHTANPETQPDIVTLADGKFVVTWTRGIGALDSDIRFSLHNQDGSLVVASSVNTAIDLASDSSVAALAGGGFVAAWQSHTAGNNSVYFRRFDANGQPLDGTADTGVSIDSIGDNTDIQVAGLPDGGFVVAYTDNGWNVSGTEITARVYNADGTPRTGYLFVNGPGFTAGDQNHPTLTVLSNGYFAVAWNNGGNQHITAFDPNGNALTPNVFAAGNVVEGEIAGLTGGLVGHVYQSTDPDAGGDDSIRHNVYELRRIITGDNSNETITGVGDTLPEELIGLDGDDKLEGKDGADRLDGGIGFDYASYSTAPTGVVANLASPGANTGDAAGDTYLSIEGLIGSAFGDALTGNSNDNTLKGGGGSDVLDGGTGADTMIGGVGDDTYLVNSASDDVIEQPGEGNDTVKSAITLLLGANVENLILTGANTINGTGNELDNTIAGNAQKNTIAGAAGNDTLAGGGGNDILYGGIGDDTAVFSGARAQYQVAQLANGTFAVLDLRAGSPDGTDFVLDVEHFAFADVTLAATTMIARNDFSGDGKSDILWQNADGTPAIWQMNGSSLGSGGNAGFNPGAAWHVIGSGDFNADGKADILWQNADGTPAVWLMNGLNVLSGANVGFNPGADWHEIAAADFNGDGKADILWQNQNGQAAVWQMDGLNVVSGANVGPNVGAAWHVIAAGDFDADGKADILWQNNSGQAAVWLMDGFNVKSGSDVGFNPGAAWHVQAAGDFNGDGKADILWQNADGTPAVWLMDGLNVLSGANVGFNPGPAWQVHGTGDFNGDGKADIEWQNTDGTPAVWLMDGTNVVAGANVGFNPGAAWHVIPQHNDLV